MFRSLLQQVSPTTRVILAAGMLLLVAESRALACSGHRLADRTGIAPYAVENSESTSTDSREHSNVPLPCSRCPERTRVPGQAPCRGPSCSDYPLPDSAPISTATPGETRELMSFCLFSVNDREASRSSWLRVNERFIPIPRTDSIFHPPRQS